MIFIIWKIKNHFSSRPPFNYNILLFVFKILPIPWIINIKMRNFLFIIIIKIFNIRCLWQIIGNEPIRGPQKFYRGGVSIKRLVLQCIYSKSHQEGLNINILQTTLNPFSLELNCQCLGPFGATYYIPPYKTRLVIHTLCKKQLGPCRPGPQVVAPPPSTKGWV